MTDRTMPESGPLRAGDPERLGAYEIIGRLGEGGQGAVFLGRAGNGGTGTGEPERGEPDIEFVAVKLLHAAWTTDEVARGRFIRELDVAKRVARFCTAQILDADMAGDQPYIVSEYVPGRSLHRLVEDEGPRTGGALERLAIGTLTALTAIHQAGIVHRDFKPHNVLMGPDGPRVIDFGVARALDAAGETQIVGTPAYMAPEQFTAASVSQATDMFAWGVTMVFAATGRPAFGNDEMAAVMHRIITGEADLAALPESLRSVVASCLAKDPAERPTAREAQERLVGGEAAGTVPSGEPAGSAEPAGPVEWPQPAFVVSAAELPAAPFPETRTGLPAGPFPHPPAVATAPPGNAPSGTASAMSEEGAATGPPVSGEGDVQDTRPGQPGESGGSRGRPVLAIAASAAAVGLLLIGGGVWAATMRGDGSAAGAQGGGGPAAASGATPGAGKGAPGSAAPTTLQTPGSSGAAGSSAGAGSNGDPSNGGGSKDAGKPAASPEASTGTAPAPGKGSGGSKGGSGGSTERTNPYSATQVCGSGYYVQRSSAFSGGRTYQLYNTSTQKNCVVTLKTANVGKATKVWAKLEAKGGGTATDRGSFSYYAGPVYVKAPGKCVRYSGGTATGSTGAGWANCG